MVVVMYLGSNNLEVLGNAEKKLKSTEHKAVGPLLWKMSNFRVKQDHYYNFCYMKNRI